jgi:two-component system, sensor histidine kinase and response regulator
MKAPSRSSVQTRSDRIINFFLPGYFLGGLIFAFFYGTWSIAFGVGGLCMLSYYLAKAMLPDSDVYQYVLSAALGIFMAQYIYQMHGLFEMHFFAFIGSAILITYQNWKLQIPIVVIVTVHHAVFGYLQNLGFTKIYFTQLDYFAMQTFVIHVGLAAVIFFISGLWAYQLNKYTKIETSQAREMQRLQNEALQTANVQKELLERHVAVLDKAVAQGKFEIASDVTHDIGNAVVGFGSYLTQVKRLQERENPSVLENLARYFNDVKPALATAIGDTKAQAVIEMLSGMADSEKIKHGEISKAITKQIDILGGIQEILHIQRQYIEGHETQERKAIKLRNIVSDALAILFAVLDKKAIAVHLDFAEDLPVLKGDRTKLIQLILNVLKNSIDSIDAQGGEKTIVIRAYCQTDVLVLEIRDTGIGFDGSIAGELFKRGFSTKPAGAGLALYNCRSIADSHTGTIDLTSDGPGKGALTTICFQLGAGN